MIDLDELIARVEAAPKGSDDLDRRIAAWRWNCPPENAALGSRYTRSLDAALALVTGLWGVHCEDGPAYCRILPPNPDGSFVGQSYIEATAATPPLAVCLAALRARKAVP